MYGTLAKHMAQTNQFLIPRLSEQYFHVFYEHPPFWMQYLAVFFKIFDAGWVQLRLANFLVVFSSVVILYKTIKSKYSTYEAFFSCVILALCFPFMKKARIPLMEVPIILFSLVSLLFYYKAFLKNRWRDWLASGLFFGLALLMKGVPALFIPLGTFIHICITKRFDILKNTKSYISFFLGLCLFMIWPLMLYLNGELHIFLSWHHRQFVMTVMKARGVIENDYFFYLKYLCKTSLPWVLLTVFGVRKALKTKDNFYLLLFCGLVGVLIPFSLAKFKYSHYILPAFVFLSAMAGIQLSNVLSSVARSKLKNALSYLIILTSVVLLVFPLTVKQRRNIPEHRVKQALKYQNLNVEQWDYFNGHGAMWDKLTYLYFVKNKSEELVVNFHKGLDVDKLKRNTVVVLSEYVFREDFHLLLRNDGVHYYCYRCTD